MIRLQSFRSKLKLYEIIKIMLNAEPSWARFMYFLSLDFSNFKIKYNYIPCNVFVNTNSIINKLLNHIYINIDIAIYII